MQGCLACMLGRDLGRSKVMGEGCWLGCLLVPRLVHNGEPSVHERETKLVSAQG